MCAVGGGTRGDEKVKQLKAELAVRGAARVGAKRVLQQRLHSLSVQEATESARAAKLGHRPMSQMVYGTFNTLRQCQ